MRIIILGTAYPYRGGLAAFNERLAREVLAEGENTQKGESANQENDEVEVLTFTMQYPDFLFPGKTQYSDDPAPKDLTIRRVMNSINPLSWIRTGRMIRRMQPDLLIIKFWIPLMAPCLGTIARIAKRGGKKIKNRGEISESSEVSGGRGVSESSESRESRGVSGNSEMRESRGVSGNSEMRESRGVSGNREVSGGRVCKRVRVVSVLDNVIPHEPKPWDGVLIRYFIRSVDGFVAMSESVRQDCLRFISKKHPKTVALCPHPLYDNFGEIVDKTEARKQLGLPETGKILLFFGFIRDYKGLDLLLRAYADARLQNEQVHLVVAGEFYNNSETYYALEKELGLKQPVIWRTEFIPDEQVRVYFSAADLIVQPYKTATQSGVTQIAYHFRKPMLVTNVGGLAEIVPNGKVGYVTAVDPQAIADALADFCAREDSECFRTGIEEERQKYSWSRMLQTIKGL